MKCPESIEELQELERLIPLCKKTLYEQAQSRIVSGAARSYREASRQLADETGRPEGTIRDAIRLGKVDGNRPDTHSQTEPDSVKSNEQFRTSFTGENEWYTPEIYIEAARSVLGEIELDPASSDFAQTWIKAKQYFTKENDGLEKDWIGKVWMNPPYSQPLIYLFIEKLVSEYEKGKITEAIILTHNYTDTAWFHLAESKAALLCFTKGRIRFEDMNGNLAAPTQGSCFFYFGENKDRFMEVFQQFGFIR